MVVAVTGAGGLLGRAVVAELSAAGRRVRAIDIAGSPDGAQVLSADLRDAEAAHDALRGASAVVHLAAWPTPHAAPGPQVWADNVAMAANVLFCAAALEVRKVVFASSQSVLGLPWAEQALAPDYLPVDEEHPCRPADPYSVSKLAGEELGAMFARRGQLDVAALRFPAIWRHDVFAACTARRLGDPQQGAKSLWAYVDARDAARAVRLALDAELSGFTLLNITAPHCFAEEPAPALVRAWFPSLSDIRAPLGESTALFDWRRAETAIGFRARYRWTPAGICVS